MSYTEAYSLVKEIDVFSVVQDRSDTSVPSNKIVALVEKIVNRARCECVTEIAAQKIQKAFRYYQLKKRTFYPSELMVEFSKNNPLKSIPKEILKKICFQVCSEINTEKTMFGTRVKSVFQINKENKIEYALQRKEDKLEIIFPDTLLSQGTVKTVIKAHFLSFSLNNNRKGCLYKPSVIGCINKVYEATLRLSLMKFDAMIDSYGHHDAIAARPQLLSPLNDDSGMETIQPLYERGDLKETSEYLNYEDRCVDLVDLLFRLGMCLKYLSDKGYVHGDFKQENVFLDTSSTNSKSGLEIVLGDWDGMGRIGEHHQINTQRYRSSLRDYNKQLPFDDWTAFALLIGEKFIPHFEDAFSVFSENNSWIFCGMIMYFNWTWEVFEGIIVDEFKKKDDFLNSVFQSCLTVNSIDRLFNEVFDDANISEKLSLISAKKKLLVMHMAINIFEKVRLDNCCLKGYVHNAGGKLSSIIYGAAEDQKKLFDRLIRGWNCLTIDDMCEQFQGVERILTSLSHQEDMLLAEGMHVDLLEDFISQGAQKIELERCEILQVLEEIIAEISSLHALGYVYDEITPKNIELVCGVDGTACGGHLLNISRAVYLGDHFLGLSENWLPNCLENREAFVKIVGKLLFDVSDFQSFDFHEVVMKKIEASLIKYPEWQHLFQTCKNVEEMEHLLDSEWKSANLSGRDIAALSEIKLNLIVAMESAKIIFLVLRDKENIARMMKEFADGEFSHPLSLGLFDQNPTIRRFAIRQLERVGGCLSSKEIHDRMTSLKSLSIDVEIFKNRKICFEGKIVTEVEGKVEFLMSLAKDLGFLHPQGYIQGNLSFDQIRLEFQPEQKLLKKIETTSPIYPTRFPLGDFKTAIYPITDCYDLAMVMGEFFLLEFKTIRKEYLLSMPKDILSREFLKLFQEIDRKIIGTFSYSLEKNINRYPSVRDGLERYAGVIDIEKIQSFLQEDMNCLMNSKLKGDVFRGLKKDFLLANTTGNLIKKAIKDYCYFYDNLMTDSFGDLRVFFEEFIYKKIEYNDKILCSKDICNALELLQSL